MRGHPPVLTAAPSQAWRRYDTDRSGYIEANELKVGCERVGAGTSPLSRGVTASGTARPLSPQGFLSDLLKKANRPYDEPKLQEYTQTIVGGSRRGDPQPGPVGPWGPSTAPRRVGGSPEPSLPSLVLVEGGAGAAVGDRGPLVSCSCGCST